MLPILPVRSFPYIACAPVLDAQTLFRDATLIWPAVAPTQLVFPPRSRLISDARHQNPQLPGVHTTAGGLTEGAPITGAARIPVTGRRPGMEHHRQLPVQSTNTTTSPPTRRSASATPQAPLHKSPLLCVLCLRCLLLGLRPVPETSRAAAPCTPAHPHTSTWAQDPPTPTRPTRGSASRLERVPNSEPDPLRFSPSPPARHHPHHHRLPHLLLASTRPVPQQSA